VCSPKFTNSGIWTITSKLSDATHLQLTTRAVAYAHPDWLGRTHAGNPDLSPDAGIALDKSWSENDVALLYIKNDKILPPRVEDDGAKRLSIGQPQSVWDLDFWGWGVPADDDLRKSSSRPAAFIDSKVIELTSDGSQSMLCSGDSGGPLMRTVTAQTNTHGTISVQAIVGVASTSNISDADCAKTTPLGHSVFGRYSIVANYFEDFIERRIRKWNGNPQQPNTGFLCAEQGVAPETIAECWGKPCSIDNDCDKTKNQYCSNAGQSFMGEACTTCETMAGGGGSSCNCIIGQCLEGPPLPLDGGS
jgi:hypothetical protein